MIIILFEFLLFIYYYYVHLLNLRVSRKI